jgi:hypothetical protein
VFIGTFWLLQKKFCLKISEQSKQKMGWATFLAIFSQTNLVTLDWVYTYVALCIAMYVDETNFCELIMHIHANVHMVYRIQL